MFKKLLILLLINYSLIAGDIKIAVAANVSYAIDNLINEFNTQYPNTKVKVTLGSSGKLTAQINYGAPYELFMSANMKYPQKLYKLGIAITKPIVYAKGSLAIFSVKQLDFTQPIKLFSNEMIKRIAVANPKTAPYGIATKEFLINSNIYNKIKKKFIYGESIAQTVSYAVTAADMGVIAKSALYSSNMSKFKENKNWIEINPSLYTPISQGIVILKNGKDNQEVSNFYLFMQSNKAKKILKEFGYQLP